MKKNILTFTVLLVACGALYGMDRKVYKAHRVLKGQEEKKKSESAAQAASSASEATLKRANAMFLHVPGPVSVQTTQEHSMDSGEEPKTPPTVRLEDEAAIVRASSGPLLSSPAEQQFVGLVHHAQGVTAQAMVSTGVGAGHSASSSSTSSSSLSR